jgi:hypothetical protein
MRNFLILSMCLLLAFQQAWAQQGDGGLPKSTLFSQVQALASVSFNEPSIANLRAEDSIVDAEKTGPWRFGFNNYTQLNLTNSGTWTNLPNGDQLWQLKIVCEAALTVNLTLENVQLPEGNELYVYNENKSFILGKFTENHLYEGQLGTELIPGNTAIVEYYVPASNVNLSKGLTIHTVTHGYRTAKEFQTKAFGSSGNCNMNVNCPDGSAWVNQRNSSIMLVSGSNGFCSGALINNVLQNKKPYVLTANHCYSNPATWIFRFNWQSLDCLDPITAPSFESLSGAVLRAKRTPSDFCLVEITGGLVNNTVPAICNPYFSGWDNTGAIPQNTTCIHHPSGDIKKISFDDQAPTISQGMNSSEANATWSVKWDRNTTTEGGSSGSPLFDENHRIIGQLWGGGASCNNLTATDFYGRFSKSWLPNASDSNNQLKYWLDPTNTGAQFLNGLDPVNPITINFDGQLSNPSGIKGINCTDTIYPSFSLSNIGATTITTLPIQYSFDGGAVQTYNWTGILPQWQSTVINLPFSILPNGNHSFTATIQSSLDLNASNNSVTGNFSTLNNGNIVTMNLNLDCYASETSWKLFASNGAILYSGNGYSNNNPIAVTKEFCLTSTCYTYRIYDKYGDGMSSCSAQNGGNGDLNLTFNDSVIGEILEANADFGDSLSIPFCLSGTVDIAELVENEINVYPNPTTNWLTVETKFPADKICITTITGDELRTIEPSNLKTTLSLEAYSAGVYFIVIHSKSRKITKQLIKK